MYSTQFKLKITLSNQIHRTYAKADTWIFLLFYFIFISSLDSFVQERTDPVLYQVEAHQLNPDEIFKLDGKMNEPFWQEITPIVDFTQQEPHEGGVPSERTEVYIAYDDNYLYIGAKLFDSEPGKILAYQKRRNQDLDTDDRFRWILDTFHDGRNAYFFEINPAGLRSDGLVTTGQGTNLNKAWDGIWDARVTVNEEGWTAEIMIPFRTLNFNPDRSIWGINFQRTIRRHNEEILWSGWRRQQELKRPQDAGILTGLKELNQGLGLEVTPYGITTADRTWPETNVAVDNWSVDTGFDISYNILPSIRTSITVNTDFAETEVDERRVNLSRFDLFFPEQRDFFLEGAGIFNFAPESSIYPFFSRTIGLHDGDPIPIRVGAKVLGRERNTNVGFYQIRTGQTDSFNAEDFTIARISQNILEESSIGLLYTRRSTHGDDLFNDRHTVGADLELSTSSFLGDKNLQFQTFFIWHNMHFPDERTSFWDRTNRGIRINYPNYPLYSRISYREFGSAYNPAVGFAPRVGFRRFQPTFGYQQILSESSLLRSYDILFRFEYLTDLQFQPETVNLTLTPVDIRFESGERIMGSVRRDFERLTFDFDILGNGSIIIPPGDYATWNYNLNFSTAGYRKLSMSGGITHEGFWTGNRTVFDLSLTGRLFPGINLSSDWVRTNADFPETSFQTDLFRFTGNIDLTPATAFTSIVQFDNVSEILGIYKRFRWSIRPGADLFLVHSYNWVQIDNYLNPVGTQNTVKFSFTHRF